MSPQQNQKIEHLLSLIEKGLFPDNLSKLISTSHELSQDTAFSLLFFGLKHIFLELDSALEGEAVDVQRFSELTGETRSRIIGILQLVRAGDSVPYQDLEDLIALHIVRLSLFRNI
jgi:hypothetical protein